VVSNVSSASVIEGSVVAAWTARVDPHLLLLAAEDLDGALAVYVLLLARGGQPLRPPVALEGLS